MDTISFGNLTTQNTQMTPEMQKRIESQENFTAIDTEKLKQDTVELTSKAQNAVKENFIFRALRNIGVEDPKKTLKSIAYTAITVVGVAAFGNKFSNKFADLGLKVDDLVKKSNFLTNTGKKLSDGKKAVSKFLKGRKGVVGDIARTLGDSTKKVGPKSGMAVASVAGPKYQFASAVIEAFQGIFYGKTKDLAKELIKDADFKKAFGSAKHLDKEIIRKIVSGELTKDAVKEACPNISDEVLKTLFGRANSIKDGAETLLTNIVGKDEAAKALNTIVEDNADNRVTFVDDFIASIVKFKGFDKADDQHEKLLKFFKEIQLGDDEFIDCKDINMIHGMDSWFTTNWIDKVGKKIFKDNWKNVSKANVGSTLIKYSATTGKLADTAAGKFVQGFPTIFTESVSNYVCDMAFINAIVIPSFIDLYNNVQDAPKEQKVATLADEFVAGVGNFTLVMPAAGAITYGIASLKNLKGKSIFSKLFRTVGRVFNFGLDSAGKSGFKNKLKGFSGGLFRCIMIMGVLNSMLSKPISKVVHKIFGKPYNKEEAQKAQQEEAQKKQIIPELGITQGELMEKMQKNPEALQKLQTDEKLVYTIAQNPKALLDLLDNKEVQYIEPKPTPASQGTILSPANQGRIGNSTNAINKKQENIQETTQKTIQNEENQSVDTATYIPSSTFTAPKSTLSKEQLDEYNSIMTKADKALAAAEKYI